MSKVLFIGNSHTYFNDMPFLFETFCGSEKGKADGAAVSHVTAITHGGRKFSEHLREPEIHYNIKFGGYDYVILQQAAHPFDGKEVLLSDGKALCDMIHAAGGKPVCYMTWAEKRFPENQAIMIESYTALANENDGILAPVGAIWETILQDADNTIELYFTDGEHASIYGSYLAAATLYASIFGKTPVGLPCEFKLRGEIVYAIEPEKAAYLQKKCAAYMGL